MSKSDTLVFFQEYAQHQIPTDKLNPWPYVSVVNFEYKYVVFEVGYEPHLETNLKAANFILINTSDRPLEARVCVSAVLARRGKPNNVKAKIRGYRIDDARKLRGWGKRK